jgi:hypothetical protein
MIVCIVDSSILCELLGVPGKSNAAGRTAILEAYETKATGAEQLLLPVAVIVEVGNHISKGGDGGARRAAAERFTQLVRKAIEGASPFAPTPAPSQTELAAWLERFPEDATRGIGLADRSLISLWEDQRRIHPHGRVYIWSLDAHLHGYDSRALRTR